MYARTTPKHPKANSKGLYPLHRVLMENTVGRILESNEVVHHINEDKSDNRIENLQLITRSHHTVLHMKKDSVITARCPVCSAEFSRKTHRYNDKKRQATLGLPCCSRSCAAKRTHSHLRSQ